jgi:hypothetical protein
MGLTASYSEALRTWPWLRNKIALPCDCHNILAPNGLMVLTHLFDFHLIKQQDWTLTMLVEWVKRSEPQSSPKVNRTRPGARFNADDEIRAHGLGVRLQ